jgi:threonine synthase
LRYISTRGFTGGEGTAADAVRSGIAPDGGLFVPDSLPQVNLNELQAMQTVNYAKRAQRILSLLFEDFSDSEMQTCVSWAYNSRTFDHSAIVPLVRVADKDILELWHGPTSAFKDLALQIMPQLLSHALVKTQEPDDMLILVATSGDTGKAALEGFKDVPRTRIMVFYPVDGVSDVQKLQMITQEGSNIGVVAVNGNFDDAQTGVKKIFADPEMQKYVQKRGLKLSSANSINWGRLAPQVVYYFSSYADMVSQGRIKPGDRVNFVVPTGNFGNILAGYYAREMGLPIHRLICASNDNNVLTDFLKTGCYDRNRPFHQTISPSMDILISSNLERLLFHATDGDCLQVGNWMGELNAKGVYSVSQQVLNRIQKVFWSDWCTQTDALSTIRQVWDKHNYLLDPHTAVAWKVCDAYQTQTGDMTPNIVLSTASPFKFADNVLAALGHKGQNEDGPDQVLSALSLITGWKVPDNLSHLQQKEILHQMVSDKENLGHIVKNFA